ncbi:hypothetical protein ACFV1A_01275 [Streptomyces seoulensis]|uniref:hypothetical protein n=1 Tax=Streptomyces seoulensis TaxID=73044 RepID=UPI00369B18F1
MATKRDTEIGRMREDQVMLLRTRDRLEFREIAKLIGADVKNTYEAWKRGRARLYQEATEAFGTYVGEQLATCRQAIDGLMPMSSSLARTRPRPGRPSSGPSTTRPSCSASTPPSAPTSRSPTR